MGHPTTHWSGRAVSRPVINHAVRATFNSGIGPTGGRWMDEKLKYRRELIFKVLAWGTFVLLLVWGYSLTQSNLFELKRAATEEAELETKLEIARNNQAEQLEREAATANNSNSAKSRVEAAQIRVDNYLAKEVRYDQQRRAVGLVIGAFIYCMIYPILVWFVYKRTELGAGATEKDVVPLWAALVYAIVISLSTFITAFLIAWF
jgi:hypothetical protein